MMPVVDSVASLEATTAFCVIQMATRRYCNAVQWLPHRLIALCASRCCSCGLSDGLNIYCPYTEGPAPGLAGIVVRQYGLWFFHMACV